MDILNEWSQSGRGLATLNVAIHKLDKATDFRKSISTKDIEILSYAGMYTLKTGEKAVAYHVLNNQMMETIDSNRQLKLVFEPALVKLSSVKKLLPDWLENGCIFRYPGKDGQWFSLSKKIFNCFGGGAGQRFNNLDPGFPRNLALAQMFYNHPEEMSILLRYDEDNFAKAFSATRGRYQYHKQWTFVQALTDFLARVNSNTGSRWEVTDWKLSHFITRIVVEDPARNVNLRRQNMATPALVFMNSDTGDCSYTAQACVCGETNEDIGVIREVTRKHTNKNDSCDEIQEFFEMAESLPDDCNVVISKLFAMRNIPADEDMYLRIVTGMNILKDYTLGIGDIKRVVTEDDQLSRKEDVNAYEVFTRILSIPGRIKNSDTASKRVCDAIRLFG